MQCVSISVYLSFSEKDEIKCSKTNIDLNEVVMHQSTENYDPEHSRLSIREERAILRSLSSHSLNWQHLSTSIIFLDA